MLPGAYLENSAEYAPLYNRFQMPWGKWLFRNMSATISVGFGAEQLVLSGSNRIVSWGVCSNPASAVESFRRECSSTAPLEYACPLNIVMLSVC